MRGRPAENVTRKMNYKLEFEDSIWHFDLNKYPNGAYLVEQIELILEEANAYGLRQEVKEWAEKELKEASFKGVWLSKLDAYVTAYHEWIK